MTTVVSAGLVNVSEVDVYRVQGRPGVDLVVEYDSSRQLDIGGAVVRVSHSASSSGGSVLIGTGGHPLYVSGSHVLSVSGNSMISGNVNVSSTSLVVVGSGTSEVRVTNGMVRVGANDSAHSEVKNGYMRVADGSGNVIGVDGKTVGVYGSNGGQVSITGDEMRIESTAQSGDAVSISLGGVVVGVGGKQSSVTERVVNTSEVITNELTSMGELQIEAPGGSNVVIGTSSGGIMSVNSVVLRVSESGVVMNGTEGLIVGSQSELSGYSSEMFTVVGSSVLSGEVRLLEDVHVPTSGSRVVIGAVASGEWMQMQGESLHVHGSVGETVMNGSGIIVTRANQPHASILTSESLSTSEVITPLVSSVRAIVGASGSNVTIVGSSLYDVVVDIRNGSSVTIGPPGGEIVVMRANGGTVSSPHRVQYGRSGGSVVDVIIGDETSSGLSGVYMSGRDVLGVSGSGVFGSDARVSGSVLVAGGSSVLDLLPRDT